jgi:hypothetical protein
MRPGFLQTLTVIFALLMFVSPASMSVLKKALRLDDRLAVQKPARFKVVRTQIAAAFDIVELEPIAVDAAVPVDRIDNLVQDSHQQAFMLLGEASSRIFSAWTMTSFPCSLVTFSS